MLSKIFKKSKKTKASSKVEKLDAKQLKTVAGGAHELTHTVQQGGGTVVKG